jgi:hypothetical protein
VPYALHLFKRSKHLVDVFYQSKISGMVDNTHLYELVGLQHVEARKWEPSDKVVLGRWERICKL